MTFDEIVRARRSVRGFSDKPIPPETVAVLAEAARWAPSACNSQTWRFVAITNKATIEQLCREGMGPLLKNKWMAQAPLVIVGCVEPDLVSNRLGKKFTGIEYNTIDFGIAMEHIVLKATELGLGTCWIGWLNTERVAAIIQAPVNIRILALLAVGYPADEPPKNRKRKPLSSILFSETWGNPYPELPPPGPADSDEREPCGAT